MWYIYLDHVGHGRNVRSGTLKYALHGLVRMWKYKLVVPGPNKEVYFHNQQDSRTFLKELWKPKLSQSFLQGSTSRNTSRSSSSVVFTKCLLTWHHRWKHFTIKRTVVYIPCHKMDEKLQFWSYSNSLTSSYMHILTWWQEFVTTLDNHLITWVMLSLSSPSLNKWTEIKKNLPITSLPYFFNIKIVDGIYCR